jgi:nucleoside-diphosphate-sugar epimerase
MSRTSILVTGTTGFIGSHLVRQLLMPDETVIASNVSGSFRHLEALRGQVEIACANIGCFTDVLRLVETHRPSTIYHIGAMLAPGRNGGGNILMISTRWWAAFSVSPPRSRTLEYRNGNKESQPYASRNSH